MKKRGKNAVIGESDSRQAKVEKAELVALANAQRAVFSTTRIYGMPLPQAEDRSQN
jgi:hypothetical protein